MPAVAQNGSPPAMILILNALQNLLFPSSESAQPSIPLPKIPESPALVSIINDFMNLLFHNPLIKVDNRVMFGIHLLDLTDAMCRLDDEVQRSRGYDATATSKAKQWADDCFVLFYKILIMFPPTARLPNIIQTFTYYLKEPHIRSSQSSDANDLPAIVHPFPSSHLQNFSFDQFFEYVTMKEALRTLEEIMSKVKRDFDLRGPGECRSLHGQSGYEYYNQRLSSNRVFDSMMQYYYYY
ncbi:hypothetical protein CVT24_012990 [Panaeolus cyanescens]|uniref:Uncharacterized protein n=1 Tax=Panaeolus cyanescens TaxID=181874 RepID=A0A409WA49_9AGAR|nr:hypothetical protein CVT24_012990 [Panaeolus cyanescens]